MRAGAGASWRWLPLLGTVVVAVAWRGGYAPDARAGVAALAGLSLLAALAWLPEASSRAARDPVVLVLAALAALTALSAAWTIGAPAGAVRDGAAVLALAAIVVAAAALPGPWGHAGILLAAALACAISGLVATLSTTEPQALQICGSWRPAGPFEYPPALALVCAGALPVALAASGERRRGVACAGALAAWLLATTVALTANRTGIALSGMAVTAAVALAPQRRAVGPMVLGLIAATAASTLILRGDLAGAGAARVAVALLPAAAFVLGTAAQGRLGAGWPRARWTAVVGAAALAATAGGVIADRGGPCGGEPSHGRVGIWRAAIETAADRPLQGHGAGTFLVASRRNQRKERPTPTRYAHDLPLEAWVELGVGGLFLSLAWYGSVALLLVRSRRTELWLLGPAVAAFPLANLLDWPWELTGTGVLWAVAAGGLVAHRRAAAPDR